MHARRLRFLLIDRSNMTFKNIVAAKVLEWQKHPNADRLRVVKLDLGDRIVDPVVCGAHNFEAGDIVALALEGAEIPQNIHTDTHEPFILEKATIRGIQSQGMICAAFELGLSDSTEGGIMILKPDTTLGAEFNPDMVQESTRQNIVIHSEVEVRLRKELLDKNDPESLRIKRYLAMPDLTRTPGNPIYELVHRITALPDFRTLDIIQTPEIVPASISFDLFDFPPDHPARSRSDTYYVDDNNILRTHTTVMWYYYLQDPGVKQRIANNQAIGSLSFGKVFRKDEIDRKHMNIFHQIDGWYLVPRSEKEIGKEDLEKVLIDIAQAVFGKDVKYRINKDSFPYTDPSLEMEIEKEGNWIEILGSGVVKGSVLDKLGLDSSKYTGWAFGFGLERLAIVSMDLPDIRLLWSDDPRVKKQLHLGTKFQEVSKYPPITRDISFIVNNDFIPNNYFDLIRDIGGNLVEQVELLDKYENAEKFGEGKVSYTYRVVYRSPEKTLTTEEIEPLQEKLYNETKAIYNAELR